VTARDPLFLPAETETFLGTDGAVKTGAGVDPATLVFRSLVEVEERETKVEA
jgi:hypothetical protein